MDQLLIKFWINHTLIEKSHFVEKNTANGSVQGFLLNEYSPPPKKNLIWLNEKKKKNQKNREKLKNAISSIHINEIKSNWRSWRHFLNAYCS